MRSAGATFHIRFLPETIHPANVLGDLDQHLDHHPCQGLVKVAKPLSSAPSSWRRSGIIEMCLVDPICSTCFTSVQLVTVSP
jgi:hypothetical protein